MGVNEDFDRLQAVAQQHSPNHQSHGPSTGTIVGVGVVAALAARNYQQRRQVEQGLRPKNLREPSVILWYLMAAVAVHVLSGFIAPNPLVFWLVFGSVIWIPAWILGLRHQARNREYNHAVWIRFNERRAATGN